MSDFTAPWSSNAPVALREPLEQVWAVTFTHPSHPDPVTLDVENGQITFDETWAPHVMAELQVRVPDDQELLDLLDPRTGARIQIEAGYRYFSGELDRHPIADLWLFDRTVNRPSNLMNLEAHSDELRMQNAVWSGGSQPPKTGATEALIWLVQKGLDPDDPRELDVDASYELFPELLTDIAMDYGDNYWSLVASIADASELWAYDDGLGTWHIQYRPQNAGSAVHQLNTGSTGNVTLSEANLSREDWANMVIVRHSWRNAAGDDKRSIGIARVLSGPMSINTVGVKALVIDRDTPASTGYANREARSILNRTFTRGRRFNVEALSAYWVRPGKTITVKLPTGPQERHLVSAVSFRFPSGDMSVRTRVPQNVTITTGE